VVRTPVLAGKLSLSCARLMAGRVTTLWVRHPLSVPPDTFQSLIVSLVTSRPDYSNAVLVGLPVYLVRRLQSVLNAAARLIYHMTSADHITDALVSLHWLRVPHAD